jgi:hypothetical protein
MLKRIVTALAIYGAAAPSLASTSSERDTNVLIRKLDVTSFPNSIGPRREPGKSTLADYGFVNVEKTPHGVSLTTRDHGWLMGFDILTRSPEAFDICFYDRGLRRPGDVRAPSYNTTTALRVRKSERGLWKAEQVQGGFANCQNDPPAA